ncbi:MAG: ROK family protein [Rhodospirillaceae bacterium]|nr:ROK family protein [Rhodospirillaceae bacterium]
MHIGFDIGGTKLAAIGLDDGGQERARLRRPVPRSFDGVVDAVAELVEELASAGMRAPSVGVSLPGVITRDGEISMIVNLPWLEGQPLRQALEARLGCPVALANDANCFALSEATDGAAAGAEVVFGVILGTGVGGGLVVRGEALVGANATAGEWGHNPWPTPEGAGVPCACGRFSQGCVETWLNGAALARDYVALGGGEATAEEIGTRAAAGEAQAADAVARYAERLAQALAGVINLLDPDVIVLGGGLSEIEALYRLVPAAWGAHASVARPATRLVRARFGPESGLRGAAWLTPGDVSAVAESS